MFLAQQINNHGFDPMENFLTYHGNQAPGLAVNQISAGQKGNARGDTVLGRPMHHLGDQDTLKIEGCYKWNTACMLSHAGVGEKPESIRRS
jgi:hypothetical protein